LNSAAAALDAARSAEAALGPGQVYADLNSAAPRLKEQVAAAVEPTGALFADVALMGPVPGNGIRTPALVSGSGAAEFARLFRPLGMPVEVIEGGPGAAATRKLVRSVFMKGLAAAAVESMEAAERTGCERWLREEIAGVLDGPGAPLLDRMLEGSRRHAVRRVQEMQAAVELLTELGIEPRVAEAARGSLEGLAAEGAARR
jgi:3-hydroxyisobutyrate dehydrogenase-like beta-hydroxyacid dehydrogenase